MKYLESIRHFKLVMLEHAYYKDVLSKYDNFLNDLDDVSKTVKDIRTLVDDLKIEIGSLNKFMISLNRPLKNFDDNLEFYICQYSSIARSIIDKLSDIFDIKNDELIEKYSKIIFPEGNKDISELFIKIEIEKNNFNRIHISDAPMIFRGINVGKTLYKTMIKKLGYISSESLDRTIDSKLVWKSISLTENFFVCGEKIIAFSNIFDYDKIINILKEFFKYELEGNISIPLDNDFIEKYNIKSELLNNLTL